uniref:hypothetical protein n=1 Tax=Okeania sp. SIO2F4 TaxID=2607790 RepID=UPI0025CCB826|nr:hypothetical protein [Okeania sp. SIO2F4]
MNQVLEYIYHHPKEAKRIIGVTDKQLIKLIENAQKIESEKKTSDIAAALSPPTLLEKKD